MIDIPEFKVGDIVTYTCGPGSRVFKGLRRAKMVKHIYKCDPNLNKNCPKTACYINGGPCERTSHAEFADEQELKEDQEDENESKN